MVICFDATTEAKKALDSLIKTEHFSDISEAISMALVNYEVLERSVSQGGPTILGEQAATNKSPQPVQKEDSQRQPKTSQLGPQLPELFFLNSPTADGVKLANVPVASEGVSPNLPPAQWLFGQYNKFLPAKASCR